MIQAVFTNVQHPECGVVMSDYLAIPDTLWYVV